MITVAVNVSLQGYALVKWLYSSTIVKIYLFAEILDLGKGPLKSTDILSKGQVARISFPGVGL